MIVSEKIAALGIILPPVAKPLAAYVPVVRVADTIQTSGQIPMVDGEIVSCGKVGKEVGEVEAQQAARTCAINALAALAYAADGVDNIARITHLTVFVNSDPDFTGQAAVANGASEFFQEVFGEAGVHTRSAVGVAVLPLNAAVEVEVRAIVK